MEKFVSFNPSLKKEMLELLGKTVDGEGYITEKTGERVLDRNGETVRLEEFAGFKKGSMIFIKNDIASLIDYASE